VSSVVLDASAVLALLNQERGYESVARAITDGAAISVINVSEVVAKLADADVPEIAIRDLIDLLGLEMIDFDAELAYQAGLLRPLTKQAGLSLGDRACLAFCKHLNLPVVTTDRVWKDLSLGVVVHTIR